MARQGKGILGAPSKSVGMITAQKHSGKDTIRSKPKPSIKTQTPALVKTKSDFQIASMFYDELYKSDLKIFFDKKYKNENARTFFISNILKILSPTGYQSATFPLIPNSIPYDKQKAEGNVDGNIRRFIIRINLQPLPLLALPSDQRIIIRWDEASDYFLTNGPVTNWTRGFGVRDDNWYLTSPLGKRRIFLRFCVSEDRTRAFFATAAYALRT